MAFHIIYYWMNICSYNPLPFLSFLSLHFSPFHPLCVPFFPSLLSSPYLPSLFLLITDVLCCVVLIVVHVLSMRVPYFPPNVLRCASVNCQRHLRYVRMTCPWLSHAVSSLLAWILHWFSTHVPQAYHDVHVPWF